MPPSNVLFQPELGNKVNRFNNPDNTGGPCNKVTEEKNETDQHSRRDDLRMAGSTSIETPVWTKEL